MRVNVSGILSQFLWKAEAEKLFSEALKRSSTFFGYSRLSLKNLRYSYLFSCSLHMIVESIVISFVNSSKSIL